MTYHIESEYIEWYDLQSHPRTLNIEPMDGDDWEAQTVTVNPLSLDLHVRASAFGDASSSGGTVFDLLHQNEELSANLAVEGTDVKVFLRGLACSQTYNGFYADYVLACEVLRVEAMWGTFGPENPDRVLGVPVTYTRQPEDPLKKRKRRLTL